MALRIILALILSAIAFPTDAPGAPSIGFASPTGAQSTTRRLSTAAASHSPTWTGPQLVGLDNDPDRSATAQGVIDRFAEVGLELPMVTIEYYEATDPCNGHDGLIRFAGPTPAISICSDLAYVLPHELAHAWVYVNLSEVDKADYVKRWDLASWDGTSDDWSDRGTEHAAFVIQQNLKTTAPRMTSTWRERVEAFEMLTGVESPLSSGAAG